MMLIKDYYTIEDVVKKDDGTTCFQIHLRPDSAVYEGHFPGEPVSPGVCNIQMIKECAEQLVGKPLLLNNLQQCRLTTLVTPLVHPLVEVTMAVDATDQIAGLNFTLAAQAEAIGVLPSGVTEEAVTIGEAPWQLPGMLSIPQSDAPVPAVVLVHGSGPNDMDETAYAVKPFRDLAAALAREGVAVLRYDKRTYTHGAAIAAGDMTAFSVEEETIQDAIAAGRLLRDDPRIDPERIFVVGHSLGAMLAPRIVAESDGLFCGMALLNGTNASLAEVIVQQNKDAVSAMTAEQQAAYAPAIAALEAQAADLSALTEEEAKAAQFAGQSAYYFWEMLQHPTPAEQMKTLALPALIINGSRDFQVRQEQGRLLWEAALDMDATWLTCLWTDVNHMLMKPDVPADVAGTIGEYAVSCTVDASVTEAICAFINHTEE